MPVLKKPRPDLTAKFREPLWGEMKKIWLYLQRVIIGPTWNLDHRDNAGTYELWLQKYNPATKQYDDVFNLSLMDHGALAGLADDDHLQYHNDTRGDARYYQKSEFIAVSTGAPDAGKPIVLDAAGHVDASMINDADIDHGSIGGLADDDHAQYHTDARGDVRYLLLDCSNDPLTGYLQTQHLGIMRAPTPNHGQIFSEAFTGTGAKVGYGGFPEFAPSGFAANSVTSIQGNVWFSGVFWGAGSNVKGLDFYPAPLVAGGIWGSANLDITGIATGGLLNIVGRTVTARYVTGLFVFPIANIFGGTDGTTALIVRGIYVPSATTTTGTWGRLCGMEIEPQTTGVVNEGLRLGGDGIGADLVFGAGAGTGGDANMYYNGTNLIIDPDLLGAGRVYIGATGDDDMLLNDIEIDGDLNHDGSNVGFYGTAPAAQSAAYTPTNVTTDRAYDANATTVDELADVLGTLIADLQTVGLIG